MSENKGRAEAAKAVSRPTSEELRGISISVEELNWKGNTSQIKILGKMSSLNQNVLG